MNLMDVNELVNMTPLKISADGKTYRDDAETAASTLLVTHVKNQPTVKSIFFPDDGHDSMEGQIDKRYVDFQQLASAYVCQEIRRVIRYGFNDAVNVTHTESYVHSVYKGTSWGEMGYQLYCLKFPDVVRGTYGNTFRAYLNQNPRQWGKSLSEFITTDTWLNDRMQRMIHGEYPLHNEQLNVLLFMVNLLDSSLTDSTYHKIKKVFKDLTLAFKSKSLPGLVTSDISDAVTAAIEKNTVVKTYPPFTYGHYEITTYGADVRNPFMEKYCKGYGFYNGTEIKNVIKVWHSDCSIL